MEIGTDADIDQLLLACLSILAVAHGLDAPFLGSDNLHALAVGEGSLIAGHAPDAVLGG